MMAKRDPKEPKDLTADERVIREAKKRFKRCETWEATARERWIEDEKFVNGDSENMYQWPDALRNARGFGTQDERPCLTINKTRQHCLQIINDARQNKTSIKVKPAGGSASFEAAQVLEGLLRHIEYISDAQSAYATATRHQVEGGIGYFRIATDYADSETLDQEIYIRRVKNPLGIYVDPDFQEADGSDMRFAFAFEDMARDEFEARYPEYEDLPAIPLDNSEGWLDEKHIRVAEYFRKVEVKDRIVVVTDPVSGKETNIRASKVPPELKDALADIVDDPQTLWREVSDSKVEWFLIAGEKVIKKLDWPGKYIPIVRVVGEETVIEGEMDRKGHVRALRDPQRMYNYNASAQVEFGALQSKIPYLAPAEAIEGYETYWQTANTANHSVLPYNGLDDQGNQIAAPQRAEPPTISTAYQGAMENAANDMMLVSGQYQADFGAPSNEQSGKAIQQRQRQGATATYHYIDHLAMAIRFAGKIILDLVPKIYDTRRLIKIMAEDGTDSDVMIDPKAADAFLEKQVADKEAAKQVIFNPNIGRYDVMADVGPDFATRRQEAFNALTQIAAANSELIPVVGDLLFKSADFEYANEIAERLERLVPAQAKGDGPDPEVTALQAQLQGAQQLLAALSAKLQQAEGKQAHSEQEATTRQYEAITKRLDVLLKNQPDPPMVRSLEDDLARAAHQTGMEMVQADHAAGLQMMTAEHAQSIAPQPEPAAA